MGTLEDASSVSAIIEATPIPANFYLFFIKINSAPLLKACAKDGAAGGGHGWPKPLRKGVGG